MKGNRAFTLIELLVVIAIIGLLATAVIASLNSAREKGRDARRVQDISQLRQALEMYYDANGSYPSALSSLGTYMNVIPTDPQTGNAYGYLSDGSTYLIYATLEGSNHPGLQSDKDGSITVNGTAVDCNDPVYCMQP